MVWYRKKIQYQIFKQITPSMLEYVKQTLYETAYMHGYKIAIFDIASGGIDGLFGTWINGDVKPNKNIHHFFDRDRSEIGYIAYEGNPCENLVLFYPARIWMDQDLAMMELVYNKVEGNYI